MLVLLDFHSWQIVDNSEFIKKPSGIRIHWISPARYEIPQASLRYCGFTHVLFSTFFFADQKYENSKTHISSDSKLKWLESIRFAGTS